MYFLFATPYPHSTFPHPAICLWGMAHLWYMNKVLYHMAFAGIYQCKASTGVTGCEEGG